MLSHRLSTIRNANIIYVFDTGEIVEEGTHDDLVAKKGAYYNLVSRQLTKEDQGGSKAAVDIDESSTD